MSIKYENYERNVKLMEDYNSGDPVKKAMAVQELLDSVKPFIHKILKAYKSFMTPDNYEDFVHEAYAAVIAALPRYNPEYALTTFIPFEIKHQLQKYISTIRGLSSTYSQRINHITRIIEKLNGLGIDNPTPKDISSAMGGTISEKQVIEALQLRDSSLIWNYQDAEECSNLFNVHAASPEEIIAKRETEELLAEALSKLSEIQKLCILHYYGAYGFDKMDNKTIAEVFNISIQEVKVNIAKALKSLKKILRVNNRDNTIGVQKSILNKSKIPTFNVTNIDITINTFDNDMLDEFGSEFEEMELK